MQLLVIDDVRTSNKRKCYMRERAHERERISRARARSFCMSGSKSAHISARAK